MSTCNSLVSKDCLSTASPWTVLQDIANELNDPYSRCYEHECTITCSSCKYTEDIKAILFTSGFADDQSLLLEQLFQNSRPLLADNQHDAECNQRPQILNIKPAMIKIVLLHSLPSNKVLLSPRNVSFFFQQPTFYSEGKEWKLTSIILKSAVTPYTKYYLVEADDARKCKYRLIYDSSVGYRAIQDTALNSQDTISGFIFSDSEAITSHAMNVLYETIRTPKNLQPQLLGALQSHSVLSKKRKKLGMPQAEAIAILKAVTPSGRPSKLS